MEHWQQNGSTAELNPDVLSGLKVLTVDDQQDTRELITLALDESKALNAGYALHLSKPIELNELAKAIARVSRRV